MRFFVNLRYKLTLLIVFSCDMITRELGTQNTWFTKRCHSCYLQRAAVWDRPTMRMW